MHLMAKASGELKRAKWWQAANHCEQWLMAFSSGKEVFTYGIWFGSYANNYPDLPYKRRDASIRNVQASKQYEKPHFCIEFFGIE